LEVTAIILIGISKKKTQKIAQIHKELTNEPRQYNKQSNFVLAENGGTWLSQRRRDGEGYGGGAHLAGGAVHFQPPPPNAALFSCPGTKSTPSIH